MSSDASSAGLAGGPSRTDRSRRACWAELTSRSSRPRLAISALRTGYPLRSGRACNGGVRTRLTLWALWALWTSRALWAGGPRHGGVRTRRPFGSFESFGALRTDRALRSDRAD